jgi:hypothetical protein
MARVAASPSASRVASVIGCDGADSSVAGECRRKILSGPLSFVRNAMRTTLGAPGPRGHDSMVPTRAGRKGLSGPRRATNCAAAGA